MSSSRLHYPALFGVILDQTGQTVLQQCLDRAKKVGETHLTHLSNAQLAGLVTLADQERYLDGIQQELAKRQERRWKDVSRSGKEPFETFDKDIKIFAQWAEEAVRQAEQMLGKALGNPAAGQAPYGLRDDDLQLELTRRYLHAAVTFARVAKKKESSNE